MEYSNLQYHYRPSEGWVNDPNGLVYFDGFYHVFYQHAPHHEVPWKEPMHWGHARTKDFLTWEELPVALCPDQNYDKNGCWSGSAIAKDGMLYLFYASIGENSEQTVSVAFSKDGIYFEKYKNNPVIDHYPIDGGPDFRDPALCFANGKYYCVMATGHPESKKGRLCLYESEDLFHWQYNGIMAEWDDCKYTECPSFLPAEDGNYLLTVSVCPLEQNHYFSVMYGEFNGGKYTVRHTSEVDKGPDQYAGQVFRDHKGRNILISWMPGWRYSGYKAKDIGCMSLPKQLTVKDGKITAYPIEEVRHLLKESDDCVARTPTGFTVARSGREPLIYNGKINDIKILRDAYFAEIFINGGEEVYSVLL